MFSGIRQIGGEAALLSLGCSEPLSSRRLIQAVCFFIWMLLKIWLKGARMW